MTSTPSTTKILSSEFQTKKNNLYNNDSLLSLSPSSPTFSNNTLNHHHNKISYGRKRLLDLYDADVDDDYYGSSSSYISFGRRRLFDFYDYTG
ncbi:899_t:CDS:2 [Diversispora eburnea]|uniref:899_t:CDS:1 n=1 Tax=Diversispora eburnea TaxID=1213867 RepID=A0A9N9FKR0_9GLOM|nr:899_t:CDS:2 [Diversispora eburnea]